MIESLLIIIFAILFDLVFGDPQNKFHPTSWLGTILSKLINIFNRYKKYKKQFGILLTLVLVLIILMPIILLITILNYVLEYDDIILIFVMVTTAIFLKMTFSIHGMEKHVKLVIDSLSNNDIDNARKNLSMLVKRKTTNLDKQHILSGLIETISENIVDGITSPLFYFAFFGLPGAFVYRTINTIDSMIGYKTDIFKDLGWFGAKCDTILNYIPSRLTGIIIIISAILLKYDWKNAFIIMIRDHNKTISYNSGYPISAFAGALNTKLEKIDHYIIGNGDININSSQIKSAILLMKTTSFLFCLSIVAPLIILLSYIKWWIYV